MRQPVAGLAVNALARPAANVRVAEPSPRCDRQRFQLHSGPFGTLSRLGGRSVGSAASPPPCPPFGAGPSHAAPRHAAV